MNRRLGFLTVPTALAGIALGSAGCTISTATKSDAGDQADTGVMVGDGGATIDAGPVTGDTGPGPAVDAGPDSTSTVAAYTPSNVPWPASSAPNDVTITSDHCVIDTDRRTVDCVTRLADGGMPYSFDAFQQSDGSQVAVLAVRSLIIQTAARVSAQGSIPLVIIAATTVNIQGSLIATSVSGPNAGGATVSATGSGGGPGGGAAGGPGYIAAGGGSYCGLGGTGAAEKAGPPTPAGRTYGSPTIVPLVGGSSGGSPTDTIGGGAGGEGGGAIQISAGTSILVGGGGILSVPGRGGRPSGGGGGSGGAILLEAPSVTINGIVAANGGGANEFTGGGTAQDGLPSAQPALGIDPMVTGNGGAGAQIDGTAGASLTANRTGGGGGGVGRIRINSASGSAIIGTSALLSPPASTPCATEGTLAPQ